MKKQQWYAITCESKDGRGEMVVGFKRAYAYTRKVDAIEKLKQNGYNTKWKKWNTDDEARIYRIRRIYF